VHSRYARRLTDAAIGGRRVVIRLTVRRFFCSSAGCKRKTSADQVPGLTVCYARKTPPLRGMLRDIAVARVTGCIQKTKRCFRILKLQNLAARVSLPASNDTPLWRAQPYLAGC
jgi:hypothetical protein